MDTSAARTVAADLSAVRTAMNGFGDTVADGSTGSAKVEDALHRFFEESSDDREDLDKLLERAISLMMGLAEGAESLDSGLADALTTTGDGATAPSGAPAPPRRAPPRRARGDGDPGRRDDDTGRHARVHVRGHRRPLGRRHPARVPHGLALRRRPGPAGRDGRGDRGVPHRARGRRGPRHVAARDRRPARRRPRGPGPSVGRLAPEGGQPDRVAMHTLVPVPGGGVLEVVLTSPQVWIADALLDSSTP